MQVNFFTKGADCLVAKISGELDHHAAEKIRNETDTRIIRGRVRNLIFDFTDLNFMDSSGIGVVIGRYKLIRSCGGNIAIVTGNAGVNKLLTMSGIPGIIKIYPSLLDVPDVI
ncbi:MAG: anti-sigma factor antagonist [Clostridia bacterium]|nr:anti-sigma factor antagonist [Clostridia bacterium]